MLKGNNVGEVNFPTVEKITKLRSVGNLLPGAPIVALPGHFVFDAPMLPAHATDVLNFESIWVTGHARLGHVLNRDFRHSLWHAFAQRTVKRARARDFPPAADAASAKPVFDHIAMQLSAIFGHWRQAWGKTSQC